MYNAHVNKKGAFHEWMFRWLAAKPVFISTVTPATRARVAQNLLRENGYFTGTTSYEIVPNKKDSLKAGVRYEITLNEPYTLDSIFYRRMQNRGDTLLKLNVPASAAAATPASSSGKIKWVVVATDKNTKDKYFLENLPPFNSQAECSNRVQLLQDKELAETGNQELKDKYNLSCLQRLWRDN